LVNNKNLKKLRAELKKCHSIGKLYANTMVAHKQNKESRRVLTEKQVELTINAIDECHKALWTVFNSVSSFFIHSSQSPVISKIHNRFDSLNKAWVPLKNKIK